MIEDERWVVIEDARFAASGNIERQAEYIAARIATRPVDEIIAFGTWVRQRMQGADVTDLLKMVAWVFDVHGLGGVSGDSWEYWKGWLVGRGRRDYYAALEDPDVVAEFFTDIDDFLSGEEIEVASFRAYEIATGSRDYPDKLYEPSLIDCFPGYWTDEEVTSERLRKRFPRMATRFGLPSFAK